MGQYFPVYLTKECLILPSLSNGQVAVQPGNAEIGETQFFWDSLLQIPCTSGVPVRSPEKSGSFLKGHIWLTHQTNLIWWPHGIHRPGSLMLKAWRHFSWVRQSAKTCWDVPDKMPTKNWDGQNANDRKKSGWHFVQLAFCPTTTCLLCWVKHFVTGYSSRYIDSLQAQVLWILTCRPRYRFLAQKYSSG